MPLKSGDRVNWTGPDKEALQRDFGSGPFTILGAEDNAPQGGQWVSLINSQGLAWVKEQWESPNAKQPGMYKAIPPTFHSDWLEKIP